MHIDNACLRPGFCMIIVVLGAFFAPLFRPSCLPNEHKLSIGQRKAAAPPEARRVCSMQSREHHDLRTWELTVAECIMHDDARRYTPAGNAGDGTSFTIRSPALC